MPSWNQLLAWLHEMDLLRKAEAADSACTMKNYTADGYGLRPQAVHIICDGQWMLGSSIRRRS